MGRYFRQIGYFRHNRHRVLVGLVVVGLVACARAQTPPAATDSAALLAKALRQLPQAEYWSADFRQYWQQGGILAEVEGSYAVGPARRARIEIRLRLADIQGQLRIYCDGQNIWRQEQIGDGEARIVRYTAAELEQAISEANLSQAEARQVHEAIWAEFGYQSLRGRLRELANRFQWGPPQASQLPDGRLAWLLEGTWNEKTLQEAFRGQLPEAAEVPRRCRLYLLRQDCWWGGDSLWPARIEWLGLPRGEKEEKVLASLDWHSPRRLQKDEFQSPFTAEQMHNAANGDAASLVREMVQRLR